MNGDELKCTWPQLTPQLVFVVKWYLVRRVFVFSSFNPITKWENVGLYGCESRRRWSEKDLGRFLNQGELEPWGILKSRWVRTLGEVRHQFTLVYTFGNYHICVGSAWERSMRDPTKCLVFFNAFSLFLAFIDFTFSLQMFQLGFESYWYATSELLL